jgi:prophage antirepressor-like protein
MKTCTLKRVFGDKQLNFVRYEGEPVWIAREVGSILGYKPEGARLITLIRNEWKEELIREKDYMLLTGKELCNFKALPKLRNTAFVGFRTKHLLILRKSGLWMVLIKTRQRYGVHVRRLVVTELSR